MNSRGGFRLATVSGVSIIVHPSWLVIFAVVVAFLASAGNTDFGGHLADGPRWTVAIVVALLFFGSVLVHELAHAIVARRRGVAVNKITLFLLGGAATLEQEAPNALTEGLMAGVGPLASFLIGAILLGVAELTRNAQDMLGVIVYWSASWLGASNLLLAAFNVIPGFPMDGGRVLRAIIWGLTKDFMRATRIASVIGRGVGQLVIAAGLLESLQGSTEAVLQGVWLVLIGWFLNRSASMSYRQAAFERLVEGVSVKDVMDTNVPVISQQVTLDTLAEQHLMTGQTGFYAITAEDKLVGTIDVEQIRHVPRAAWTTTRVGEVMRQGSNILSVTEPTSITAAVNTFERTGVAALPVVAADDSRRLLGMVTRESLLRALQARARIRADAAQAPTNP